MRITLFACLMATLFLGACDDDNQQMMSPDLAVVTQPDLTPTAGSCAAGITCVMGCTGANALGCGTNCFNMVSTANQPYFQTLIDCIQLKCTSLGGDAGTADCDDPQAATCGQCVQSKCVNEAIACFQH
jgi:hypothetical protein